MVFCEVTIRNFPQKMPMKKFIRKNSLTRQILFPNFYSNFLYVKEGLLN